MIRRNFLLLPCILIWCSCAKKNLPNEALLKTDLQELTEWMTGTFDSSLQASVDSSYFDISLTMVPIWESDKNYSWLYVEQAISANKIKPYRQRIYRLSENEKGRFESKVYTLESPETYIHAWNKINLFETLQPDQIIEREGCSVFLNKVKTSYSGKTFEHNCKSSMKGASSATSEVQVTHDRIVSWDQGWNDKGIQVWGAKDGGYVFMKKF